MAGPPRDQGEAVRTQEGDGSRRVPVFDCRVMRRNAAVDMLIGQRTGNFEAAVACKYSTCDRVQREGGAQSARRDVFPEQRLTQGRAIKLQSVFRGHRCATPPPCCGCLCRTLRLVCEWQDAAAGRRIQRNACGSRLANSVQGARGKAHRARQSADFPSG
jgi:hypothetical protein